MFLFILYCLRFFQSVTTILVTKLLLLSRCSRGRLCVPPQTAAHQAPRPRDSPSKNTGVGCHCLLQCMKVESESEVAQLCLTLCNPMVRSPPGSSIHGIFQARVLEWAAIAFSVWQSSSFKKYDFCESYWGSLPLTKPQVQVSLRLATFSILAFLKGS